ncbi:MAG TPA: patatin-like phospholipase family protein [Acidimicrobiales bacterium]|nr:patatin-like phospholipase family protein [Acidimicrobiales bacterium]
MTGNPAFVLSGGGNLGALQVGMLGALIESGVQPAMIVGTSVGAVNGTLLASRPDAQGIGEIVAFWSSLRRRDLLGVSATTLIGGLLGLRGYLFDSTPMRKVLDSFLTFRRLEDAPLPLSVVATDVATREPVVLRSGDTLSALMASCAIPGVLPPVAIDSRLLVDGAVSADIPLREALALGAQELYVIPTAPLQVERLLRQEPSISSAGGPDGSTVRIVTPPRVRVPLGDLRQSVRLIDLGYQQARAWIAHERLAGEPGISGYPDPF